MKNSSGIELRDNYVEEELDDVVVVLFGEVGEFNVNFISLLSYGSFIADTYRKSRFGLLQLSKLESK